MHSETSLSRWATFFSVVGWLGVVLFALGIFAVISDISSGIGSSGGLNTMIVGSGASATLSGFFASSLLRGAADVIRLLKKSNGIPYEGQL